MRGTTFDAAIVGAGPAGAALATLLARAGWSVALIERQTFPRRKVCGECIAASNLALLDALGVGAALAERAGGELRRVALMHGDATIVAPLPAGDSAHRFGRALGREHLDTLLAGAAEASGATRWQPWSLQSIAGAAGRFVLRVRREGAGEGSQEQELTASLVVAAHGSWQPLPSERAELRATRASSDLFAFKANFRGATLARDLLPVLSFAGGYGGMVVADDGILTLAGCVRADRLRALRASHPGLRAGDAFEAMLRGECGGVRAALAGAAREGPWLASGPLRPGIRVGERDGIFRVGNAAGEAHPIVGEGISMALQSAFVLAAALAPARAALTGRSTAAAAQRSAHAAYSRLWRRRFARRLAVAAAFAQIATRPGAVAAASPFVRRWPAILTAGARWSDKTRCAPEAARLVAAIA
ncbi:MAG: FAD-dependent monooxygenase [Rhizobacter sp.]|nr:FAD-dependent monooxygenase [Rhizobacter sp.]